MGAHPCEQALHDRATHRVREEERGRGGGGRIGETLPGAAWERTTAAEWETPRSVSHGRPQAVGMHAVTTPPISAISAAALAPTSDSGARLS